MPKEVQVYQANPLIESRRDFSLTESRLFYLGLRDVVPKLTNKETPWQGNAQQDFPVTVIPAKELVAMFGNDKYYNTLQGICETLAEKTIKVRRTDKKGFSVYPVFAELTYTIDEGLKLEFNSKMKPLLLDLTNRAFTKLPFEQIWALRSSHAIRILELVLQYQNTKTHERTITIEELKHYLGMEQDSYKGRNNTFKEKVVMGSVNDINQKTAYKIEVETISEGRRMAGFKFKLYLPAEIKKEERAKQIKDIGKITNDLANNASMEPKPEPPPIDEEKRAKGKKVVANFLNNLKGMK